MRGGPNNRLWQGATILLLVGIAVGAWWLIDRLSTEVDNRYLLGDLAEYGAETLEKDETLGRGELWDLTRKEELNGLTLDAWGETLRFVELADGEYEWRSAGKDGEFETKDDRYSRFRAGEVTAMPSH